MICAGIDAGSRAIKAILLDTHTFEVVASGTVEQGIEQQALALQLLERLLKEGGISPQRSVQYRCDGLWAECSGLRRYHHHRERGVRHLVPDAMTVIEIGGQDSKLIRLDTRGSVRHFAMNDRCAAGTGRCLEVVATRLDIQLKELGGIAKRSRKPAAHTPACVFLAGGCATGLYLSFLSRYTICVDKMTLS